MRVLSMFALLSLAACGLSPEERYEEAFLQDWTATEAIGEGRVSLPDRWTDEDGHAITFDVHLETRFSGSVVFGFEYTIDGEGGTPYDMLLTGDWRQLSIRPEAFDVDLTSGNGDMDGDCVISEDLAAMSCDFEGTLYEFVATP